jgi:hypothetical protein
MVSSIDEFQPGLADSSLELGLQQFQQALLLGASQFAALLGFPRRP